MLVFPSAVWKQHAGGPVRTRVVVWEPASKAITDAQPRGKSEPSALRPRDPGTPTGLGAFRPSLSAR
jgi:hypothetical protein